MLLGAEPLKDAEMKGSNLELEERFYDFKNNFMEDKASQRTKSEDETLSAIKEGGLAENDVEARGVLPSLLDHPIRYNEIFVFELTKLPEGSYVMRVRGYDAGRE